MNIYGYIRVSSRDQNEDRQLIALKEVGVPEKQIYLDKQSGKRNIDVPVSPACNLVYIPKSENRGKGDMTYYQKQKADANTYTLNADALDALAYPLAKELSFVNSTMTITERNFRAFLDAREKFITRRFITNLYKS